MTSVAIQTANLTRDFGQQRVLDDLTLTVPAGTVFGFLGPNGAGKTTTIRLLLGLLEPTHGTAEVLGFDTQRQGDSIRERTGALLEHPGLYERLSAEDNLEFYGRVWHMTTAKRQERIRELLTHLGLWERRNETVGTWSRGMKQKLAMARAMLHSPTLLFLDEPTAGLDPIAAVAFRDDITTLVEKEGVTVFLTTHHLVDAEKLCALVGVIRNGKLLTVGSPDALRAQRGGAQFEITGTGINSVVLGSLRTHPGVLRAKAMNNQLLIELIEEAEISHIVTQLVQQGVAITGVQKGRASLEDVFLSLMEENT